MVSQADVQPLLTGPITSVKPAPSDPDSCVFSTAGYSSISVTVRSTGGKDTLASWHKGPVTPVPGVGDDAVWEPRIQELVASRGDTLCTVMAMGSQAAAVTAGGAGTICNKIFAGA
jgi:cytochrome c5